MAGIVSAGIFFALAATSATAATLPNYDIRDSRGSVERSSAAERSAQRALRSTLGVQGVVDAEPGERDVIARLDGYLTGPEPEQPSTVVRAFAREHARALGTTPGEIDDLQVAQRQPLPGGATKVVLVQEVNGIPVYDGELRGIVDRQGRLVTTSSSLEDDLDPTTLTPGISARDALAAALRNARSDRSAPEGSDPVGPRRTTTFPGGHEAKLILFDDGSRTRLAWRVLTWAADDALYDYVIDAATGEVLIRSSLTNDAAGLAWEYYPGAASGGSQLPVAFDAEWLTGNGQQLAGNNVHAFANPKGNERIEVPPNSGDDFNYDFQPVNSPNGNCGNDPNVLCSWNHENVGTWDVNYRQNTVQVFVFNNRFHDWMKESSIAFTEALGNFQEKNFTGLGREHDPVQAHTVQGVLDGQRNNANMSTPPDGRTPRMNMYLFEPVPQRPTTRDRNSGDTADVMFHEYTHGLSNRLVIDSDGFSTLIAHQARSMGEGWSDWYAFDYLVAQGLESDDPNNPGELNIGRYLNPDGLRTEGIDCPVGSGPPGCPGTPGTGPGGYTFGDLGKLRDRGPEVHDDGEIWAQTLWDVRTALIAAAPNPGEGASYARNLITRAMSLSAPYPSFLDMRNAIIQADLLLTGGANNELLWKVFANRGMGYSASVVNSNDVHPIESFDLPPTGQDTGKLAGKVTTDQGTPLAGQQLALNGSPFARSLIAVTGTDGSFTFNNVPAATYPRLSIAPVAGYDLSVATDVTVAKNKTTTVAFAARRDWAAAAGGARITSADPLTEADFATQCPAGRLIDQNPLTGVLMDRPTTAGTDPQVTVQLPAAVDLTELAINPGPPCADYLDAYSLGQYRVETSSDGVNFQTAAEGTFTSKDNGDLRPVALQENAGRAVRAVRLVAIKAQDADDGVGASELAVYGRPAVPPTPEPPPQPTPAPAPAPQPAPPIIVVPPANVAGVANVRSRAIRFNRRGRAVMQLACGPQRAENCRGTLTIRAKVRRRGRLLRGKRRTVTVTIAKRAYSVRAGRTAALRVTGRRQALARLPRGRLVPASVVIQPDRASRAAGARQRIQPTYVSVARSAGAQQRRPRGLTGRSAGR